MIRFIRQILKNQEAILLNFQTGIFGMSEIKKECLEQTQQMIKEIDEHIRIINSIPKDEVIEK
jgi:tryptophanyl-tRNA synthetase